MSALAVLVVGVGCTSPSSQPDPATGSSTPSPSASSSSAPLEIESEALRDGARSLFSLRDADGLGPGDQVYDLGSTHQGARIVGGKVFGTVSPSGGRAARFARSGRITTALSSGLSGSDTFTIEAAVRVDACTTAWGRVLGTSSYGANGREGLELIHYPKVFPPSACRLGVEMWHQNTLQAGCYPEGIPALGRWLQFTIVYTGRAVSCYVDGAFVSREKVAAPVPFGQPGPLGIGGSGSGFQGPADGVSIAEVAVYPKALSPALVRSHFSALTASNESSPAPGGSSAAPQVGPPAVTPRPTAS